MDQQRKIEFTKFAPVLNVRDLASERRGARRCLCTHLCPSGGTTNVTFRTIRPMVAAD